MTRAADARLGAYAALAAAALVAALGLRRTELAALAAPFVLLVALGVRARTPGLRAWLDVDRERALEGDVVAATVTVRADEPVDRLEVGLALPEGLELVEGRNPVALRLAADEERELPLRLRCTRWSSVELGDVWLRARDRIGLVRFEGRIDRRRTLRIYPTPEHLRRLLAPAHTQATTGSEVARARAEGLEFADTRPFVPGDRVRSINWRATARRATLVVSERHPERNADIVIFLDSFAEARSSDEGTLEQAVRAAATLADRFLARRDRVGLVTFGGILRWLEPGGGLVQRYRLVDALLETGIELSYAWKDVDVIPARTLPPRALVAAVTPLLDERSVAALLDLRARGHDLVVLEVSPEPYLDPPRDRVDLAALRLWRLERAALRARFERLGAAVATLDDVTTMEEALRGGEGIPASRPSRALAAGTAAVGVASGVAAWLGLAASPDAIAPVLALGAAGTALTAAAVVWPAALGPALAALAGGYAVLLVVDDPPLDSRAAGLAASLVVVGELAGWSRELGHATRDEPGNAWRRPAWIAGAGIGALGLAWGILAVADLARVQGLAVEAVGALAALGALLVVRRGLAQPEPRER